MTRLLPFITAVSALFIQCQNPSQGVPAEAPKSAQQEPRNPLRNADQRDFIAEGKPMVLATFTALSSALKSAMLEGGPSHAISFCNERALPITDSLSEHLGVNIKRVSNKYRNPDNAANEYESELIAHYSAQLAEGGTLVPEVYSENGLTTAYFPIQVQGLCLTCHGVEGTELTEKVAQTLARYYPEDRAKGYALDDVRGLWAVTFPE